MPLAVAVRFDMVDAKNKSSHTTIRVPSTFSIPQYIEFAQAMGQLISDISQAKIKRASFVVELDLSSATIKAVAGAFSDIAHKAYFGFNTIVSGFRSKMRIPALDETKVNAASDTINQIDTDVAAFMTAVENGIVVTGGTISPTDARGNDIVSTNYAREVFRGT